MQSKWLFPLLAAAGLTWTAGAVAQGFPNKNLNMVVPYTAGGSADAMSRAIATRLGTAWGRPWSSITAPAPAA